MVSAAVLLALPACLCIQCTLGLSQPPRGAAADPTQHRVVADRALPSLGEYTYRYKYRHAVDPHRAEPLPDGVRVVFGVATMLTNLDQYWRIIQDTWMKQRGVCTLGSPPRRLPNCSVYVTQVVGQPGAPESNCGDLNGQDWAFQLEDVLWLNQAENLNHGKTFWLFHVLAREVPWATHIAKVDMDAYPYIYKLVSFLHSKQSCSADYQYMGSPVFLRGGRRNPCNLTKDERGFSQHDLQQFCSFGETCADPNLGCLDYHYGGMYVLSRSLALDLTDPSGHYAAHKCSFEDLMLGGAVRKFIFAKSACISLWRAHNAWHHQFQVIVDPDNVDNENPDDAVLLFDQKAAKCGPSFADGKDSARGTCEIPKLS